MVPYRKFGGKWLLSKAKQIDLEQPTATDIYHAAD